MRRVRRRRSSSSSLCARRWRHRRWAAHLATHPRSVQGFHRRRTVHRGRTRHRHAGYWTHAGGCRRHPRRVHLPRSSLVDRAVADLQAGEYRFDRPRCAVDVIERLARGDVYARPLTFPEGLTIRGDEPIVRVARIRDRGRALSQPRETARSSRISIPRAADLEGYLFPGDVRCSRGARRRSVSSGRWSIAFARHTPTICGDALRRRDLTTRQVVSLASLVEKETGKPDERPLVAAVYRNRSENRHGTAGRSNGRVRAAKGRTIRRQYPPVGSRVRFALQHVPLRRACRQDRLRRQARRRSKRR